MIVKQLTNEYKKISEADKKAGGSYATRVQNDIKTAKKNELHATIAIIKTASYSKALRTADEEIAKR